MVLVFKALSQHPFKKLRWLFHNEDIQRCNTDPAQINTRLWEQLLSFCSFLVKKLQSKQWVSNFCFCLKARH